MKREESKDKILYICESEMTAQEYGEMTTHFPIFYWYYVAYGTVLSVIITILFCLIEKADFYAGIFIFIIFEIIIFIVYKIRLKTMAEKGFLKVQKKKSIDTYYITEFYENYLIRESKSITRKIEYKQIIKVIETNTHFYLKLAKKIIVIPKNKCEEDLLKFIRNKFINILKTEINEIKPKKEIKQCNSSFVKNLLIVLFILTLASLWGALGTMSLLSIEESEFEFLKNTWVFWLWLPIPILSIILGFKYKKQGIKCTKNIVAGFIIGFLLLIYGCFSLLFKDLNDFTNSIFVITQNENTEEIKYYEVNYQSNKRQVEEFESDVDEIFSTDECYDSSNGNINELTWDTCNIFDENDNIIEISEELKNILINIQKNQESVIFEIKILKLEDDYYVVEALNVNMWTPYEFYYYNSKNEELEYIYTFSNEDVVGIKLK